MRITRIYTGSDGESHFEDLWIPLEPGRHGRISELAPVTAIAFRLTDEGAERGEEIHKRHRVLRGFLTDVLGLPPKAAEEYACKMEHAVDAEFLERLGQFVRFVLEHPSNGPAWLAEFHAFRGEGAGGKPRRAGKSRGKATRT